MDGIGSEIKRTNEILTSLDALEERTEHVYPIYIALKFILSVTDEYINMANKIKAFESREKIVGSMKLIFSIEEFTGILMPLNFSQNCSLNRYVKTFQMVRTGAQNLNSEQDKYTSCTSIQICFVFKEIVL